VTASTHTADRPDIHDWHLGDIAVFDTETTGVDVGTDRIVTAYFGVIGPDGDIVKFREWLIAPGVPIPPGATAVHGITTEFAEEHGEEPASALAEILDCFAAAATALIPVTVYNAPFDLTLVDRESRRHLGRPLELRCPILDPLVLDKHLAQYRKGSRRLADVCAVYGVELTDAHEAAADALATGALVRAMAAQHPQLAAAGLRALWVSQRQWAIKQQGGLVEYFLRKGEDEKARNVRLAWPVVPAPNNTRT
jgi:DNA polymerase-3 subunit epsilon